MKNNGRLAFFMTEKREAELIKFIYNTLYEQFSKSAYINENFPSIHDNFLKKTELIEHSIRATEIAIKIAKEIGLNDNELLKIYYGSLFHDIGKIYIPEDILFKPDKLIEIEWEIIKKHPEFGCEILDKIDLSEDMLEIPFCHHERWDGSGYPRGIKKEEIPLSARIFAVADVYDALTNVRAYRSAWFHEKAVQYLIDNAGKHFDPEIVKIFLKVIKKV